MHLRKLLFVLAAALLLAPLRSALAESYPERPVRIINAYAAGGPADIMTRFAASYLQKEMGGSFVVESRPGGNSTIGTQYVAHAAPDGYTLLMAANTHVIIPSLYEVKTYDPIKDFVPLGAFAVADYVLVVNPALPVHTLSELIAYAKSKNGQLTYGSPANGSLNDLAIEYLKQKQGLDIVRVPFTGGGPAVNAVMGGEVSMMVSTMPSALPLIKAGRLTAIAVTGSNRYAGLPDTPTADSTEPGMLARAWYSFLAPAGTPQPIVDKLAAAIAKFIASDEFKTRIEGLGAEPADMDLAAFRQFMRSEQTKWAGVAASANIKFSQ